jgi:hypothetical protein
LFFLLPAHVHPKTQPGGPAVALLSVRTVQKAKCSKQPPTQFLPVSSNLNEEFEENQKEREFDVESDENDEEALDLHCRDNVSKESKKGQFKKEFEKEEAERPGNHDLRSVGNGGDG